MAVLVTSDYVPPAKYTCSKFVCLATGQSNLGWVIGDDGDDSHPINGSTGYFWQGAMGGVGTLLGLDSIPAQHVAYQSDSTNPAKGYTCIGGTGTYEADKSAFPTPAAYDILLPVVTDNSGSNPVLTDPSTWGFANFGNGIKNAFSYTVKNLASDALLCHCRLHDENDQRSSQYKMTFYPKALARVISYAYRSMQPLSTQRQPVFIGWSANGSNVNTHSVNTIRAAQLAQVNSGNNVHWMIGNPHDCLSRGSPPDYAHMTQIGGYRLCGRAMFQMARKLSEAGWGTTNCHQWVIGLGSRIKQWTVPSSKIAHVVLVHDRADDWIPQAAFSANAWWIQDGSTQINVLGCGYLNSTTMVLTLDGTPSAAAVMDFCGGGPNDQGKGTGMLGEGSLPTCNWHTKVALMPVAYQGLVTAWLQSTGIPVQRLDEPLQRDAIANISADNVLLGNLSTGGGSGGSGGGNNNPPTITINTIAGFVSGAALTVAGAISGPVPTGLQYQLDGGGATPASSPNIGTTSYSFVIPSTVLGVGTHTVTVIETNAPSVAATSNSFAVSAPTGTGSGTTLTPIPSGYVQAFIDTFPGTSLNKTKWGQIYDATIYQSGNATLHLPGNVLVNNGLRLQIIHDGNSKISGINAGWSGASISTVTTLGLVDRGNNTGGGFAFNGGLAIFKNVNYSRTYGLNPVLLLWAEDTHWPDYEIDIVEDFNTNKNGYSSGWQSNNHFNSGTDAKPVNSYTNSGLLKIDLTKGLTEIGCWWDPDNGRITIYGNGIALFTYTVHVPVKQFAYIGLSAYTGAYGQGPIVGTTPSPCFLSVGSVEHWIDPSKHAVRGPGAYLDTGNTGSGGGNPQPAPVVVTITKPAALPVGQSSFLVSATGTYKLIELCWGSGAQASPPAASDPGWTAVPSVTLLCAVTVTGAGTIGGLWYRVDGGTAVQEWTIVPYALSAIEVDPIGGTQAGFPVYVTGEYSGQNPSALAYAVDVATGVTPSFTTANAFFYIDETGTGIYSFLIAGGLPAGSHTLTVAYANDHSVFDVSPAFTISASTGSPPTITYPSVQSSSVPMSTRPGFNPNLNVPYSSADVLGGTFNRDWTNTIALGYAGKGGVAGWRMRPVWRKSLGSYGQPGVLDATFEIAFRVIMGLSARAGSSSVINITTNPGAYMIPVGEPMVFWAPGLDDASVQSATTFTVPGLILPLKAVMTVVDATSVTWTDANGNAILDATGEPQTVHRYGIQLPAGTLAANTLYWDYRASLAAASLSSPILYGRHNSFYKDSQTKTPRVQVGNMLALARNQICQNGGVFCYGGDTAYPATIDYWSERNAFGDVITKSFLCGEMEYVGAALSGFGDPSLIAVEIEHEPAGPWTNVVNGVDNGVRDMITNMLMPMWRTALGSGVTIIAKGTQYGSLAWALANFDIIFPNDGPYGIAAHIDSYKQNFSTVYPNTATPAVNGYNQSGTIIQFLADSDAQYVADALSVLKLRTGAKIAGLTQFGHAYDYTQFPLS